MIQHPPTDWRELQSAAAQILTEAGVRATVDKVADTVRGPVNIDVIAVDDAGTPTQEYFLECKHWRRRVPKTVVHAFRTVVADSGANWGAIITLQGFQSGAVEAARCSNVRLLTWSDFENLFAHRWFNRHFLKTISTLTEPFFDYTEPVDTRVARKASALAAKRYTELSHLAPLFTVCTVLRAYSFLSEARLADDFVRGRLSAFPELPLRKSLSGLIAETVVTADILAATQFRDLLSATNQAVSRARSEIDTVFGEDAPRLSVLLTYARKQLMNRRKGSDLGKTLNRRRK